MAIDNIVIGTPVCSYAELGILDEENTLSLSFEEARNDNGDLFLPAILVQAGLFNSTSEIRRLNKDRLQRKKLVDPLEKDIWRKIVGLEFTHFRVGRKIFWLVVGEDKPN